ncbi:hypothetical protein JCM8208_001509 [Rhodotorula glutinis]
MGQDLDRFITKLPDYLRCPVCLDAAYPPVVACSSEHTLCEECAGKLRLAQAPAHCPKCREVMSAQVKISPGLKRLIESYGYRCDKQDCIWVGSVADADAFHRLECSARDVQCTKCYESYPLNRKQQHDDECPGAQVVCPRGGPDCGGEVGGGTRIRSRMSEHTRKCTSYQCKVDGCTTRTTLNHLAAHENACRALHDKLAAAVAAHNKLAASAEADLTNFVHERSVLEEDNALATNALDDLRLEHAQELAAQRIEHGQEIAKLRVEHEVEMTALRWPPEAFLSPSADKAHTSTRKPVAPIPTRSKPTVPRGDADRLSVQVPPSKKPKRA